MVGHWYMLPANGYLDASSAMTSTIAQTLIATSGHAHAGDGEPVQREEAAEHAHAGEGERAVGQGGQRPVELAGRGRGRLRFRGLDSSHLLNRRFFRFG